MRRVSAALVLLVATPCAAAAQEYVIKASPKVCVHGLHRQPAGGPFSVFLFCDDALGSNIGVISTAPGAGPGRIQLPPPKIWDKWDVTKRFWQESAWATDVTSFAWSPDLKSLYVGTMEIYGDGSAEITGIDRQTGEVSVDFSFTDELDKTSVTKVVVK